MKQVLILFISITTTININAQKAIHKYGMQELGLLKIQDTVCHNKYIKIIDLMADEHCRNYIQKDCDLTGQQSRWHIEYYTARYDDLLNIYYKIIIDILKINEDSAWVYIKESQRDWIKLRNNTEKYAWEKKFPYGRTDFPENIIFNLYRNRTHELYEIIIDMHSYSRPKDKDFYKLPSYISKIDCY